MFNSITPYKKEKKKKKYIKVPEFSYQPLLVTSRDTLNIFILASKK